MAVLPHHAPAQTAEPASVVITAARPVKPEHYEAVEARIGSLLKYGRRAAKITLSGCNKQRFFGELTSPATRGFCGRAEIKARDKSLKQAMEAFGKQDYPAALALFKQAYRTVGDPDAALMLAYMHLDGVGAPKDAGQGMRWLREVADAPFDPRSHLRFNPAYPQAMTSRIEAALTLARIYADGDGAAQDWKQAQAWYAKAAHFGFVPALDLLGHTYLAEDHSGKQLAKAIASFKEAAEEGYWPARQSLRELFKPPGFDLALAELALPAPDGTVIDTALAMEVRADAPQDSGAGSAAFTVVQVTGLRAVPWKSYRAMRAALAAYDSKRALAPDAVFSFAVLPPAGTRLPANFKLRVRTADGQEVPIALENGELFQLPLLPDPKADADLVSNLPGGRLRIGLLVHSRGVPPEKERLGDIRLRSHIHQAIEDVDNGVDARNCRREMHWVPCARPSLTVWHVPRAPVHGAWIVEDGRREALDTNGDPRVTAYRMPLADRRWGNDALIEFDYQRPPPALTLADVAIYSARN